MVRVKVRVKRRVFGVDKETVVAGYGDIPLDLAIKFLDRAAYEEARGSRIDVREDNITEDGITTHRRVLVGSDGRDVVLFYLEFKD